MYLATTHLASENLCIVTVCGTATREEILACSNEMGPTVPSETGKMLVDMRDLHWGMVRFDTMLETARRMTRRYARDGCAPERYCLLVRGDVGLGMAQMYRNLLQVSGATFPVVVAESLDEAASFLDVPVSLIGPATPE